MNKIMKQNETKTPKIALWFLAHVTRQENKFSITGDAEEDYKDIRQNNGFIIAALWIWFQVLISLP